MIPEVRVGYTIELYCASCEWEYDRKAVVRADNVK